MALQRHGPLMEMGVPSMVAAGICLYTWVFPPRDDVAVNIAQSSMLPPTKADISVDTTPLTSALFDTISNSHCCETPLEKATPTREQHLGHSVRSSSPATASSTSTTFADQILPTALSSHFAMFRSTLEDCVSKVAPLVTLLWILIFGQGVMGWISLVVFVIRWIPDRFKPHALTHRRDGSQKNAKPGTTLSQVACRNCLSAWRHLQVAKTQVQDLNTESHGIKAAATANKVISRFAFVVLHALFRTHKRRLERVQTFYQRKVERMLDDAERRAEVQEKEVSSLEHELSEEADLRDQDKANAEQEIARFRAQLESAQQDLSENRQTVVTLEQQLEKLRSFHEKVVADLERETETARDLADHEAEKAEGEMDLMRRTLRYADERASGAQQLLADYKQRAKDAQELHEAQVAALERKVKEAIYQQEETEQEVHALRDQLQNGEAALAKQQELLSNSKELVHKEQVRRYQEVAGLRKEVEEVERLRDEERNGRATAEREVHDVRAQLQEAEEELDEHRERLINDTSEEDKALLAEQIVALKGEVKREANLREEGIAAAEREKQAFEMQHQTTAEELSKLQLLLSGKPETQTISTQTEVAEVRASSTQTEAATTDAQTQTAELAPSPAMLAAEQELQTLHDQLASKDQEILSQAAMLANKPESRTAGTQTEPLAAEAQTAGMDADYDMEAAQAVTSLQAELAAARGELVQASAAVDGGAQRIRMLEQQLNLAEHGRIEAQALTEQSKAEHLMLAQGHSKLQEDMRMLQQRFDADHADAERHIHNSGQNLNEARAVAEARRIQVSELESRLVEHEMTVSALQQGTQTQEAELRTHAASKVELLAKLQQSESSSGMMRTQVEREQERASNLQSEVEGLREQVRRLENQLATADAPGSVDDDLARRAEEEMGGAGPWGAAGVGEGQGAGGGTRPPTPGGDGEMWPNYGPPLDDRTTVPQNDDLPPGFEPMTEEEENEAFEDAFNQQHHRKKLIPRGRLGRMGRLAAQATDFSSFPAGPSGQSVEAFGLPSGQSGPFDLLSSVAGPSTYPTDALGFPLSQPTDAFGFPADSFNYPDDALTFPESWPTDAFDFPAGPSTFPGFSDFPAGPSDAYRGLSDFPAGPSDAFSGLSDFAAGPADAFSGLSNLPAGPSEQPGNVFNYPTRPYDFFPGLTLGLTSSSAAPEPTAAPASTTGPTTSADTTATAGPTTSAGQTSTTGPTTSAGLTSTAGPTASAFPESSIDTRLR